jgi:hypothetical protein
MRVVLLVVVVSLSGCRTPPYDHPITDDFGFTAPLDLGAPNAKPIDLSSTGGSGCNALLQCTAKCQDNQCEQDCYDNASSDAQGLYDTASTCLYDFCLQRDGTRPPRCVMTPDGNVGDLPDAGVGHCDRCLQNAFAQLFGQRCMPMNDPDCNPAVCASDVKMCQAN